MEIATEQKKIASLSKCVYHIFMRFDGFVPAHLSNSKLWMIFFMHSIRFMQVDSNKKCFEVEFWLISLKAQVNTQNYLKTRLKWSNTRLSMARN